MTIVQFDPDTADGYIGDEADGCYYKVQWSDGEPGGGGHAKGYYCTIVVDCDTAGFVEDLENDAGPFDTKEQALNYGRNSAIDWCINNRVDIKE